MRHIRSNTSVPKVICATFAQTREYTKLYAPHSLKHVSKKKSYLSLHCTVWVNVECLKNNRIWIYENLNTLTRKIYRLWRFKLSFKYIWFYVLERKLLIMSLYCYSQIGYSDLGKWLTWDKVISHTLYWILQQCSMKVTHR